MIGDSKAGGGRPGGPGGDQDEQAQQAALPLPATLSMVTMDNGDSRTALTD